MSELTLYLLAEEGSAGLAMWLLLGWLLLLPMN